MLFTRRNLIFDMKQRASLFSPNGRSIVRVLPLIVLACSISTSARAQESPVAGQSQIGTGQERDAVVVSQRGTQIALDFGSDDGARVGMELEVRRADATLMRVRVLGLSPSQSTAQILEQTLDATTLTVGDTVRIAVVAASPVTPTPGIPTPSGPLGSATTPTTPPPIASLPTPGVVPLPVPGVPASGANTSTPATGMSDQAQMASQRTPKAGDYIAALAGLALVLSAKADPSRTADTAFIADQQFSAISPFPGGGYSVLPSGQIRPGGAFAVNIPLAYASDRLSGAVNLDVAQNRGNQSIGNSNGRNGTVSAGLGFGVAKRPVWVSAMFLSTTSFSSGGDAVYNALVQLAPETNTIPAIAIGVQDVSNQRERSPFLVATKQLRATRPLFATLGVGRGRFAGSTLFGGLSYSPANRVSLSGEYDGLQLNVGAGYAFTSRFSVLAAYNDLAQQSDRPAGRLGRRYQFGANYGF